MAYNSGHMQSFDSRAATTTIENDGLIDSCYTENALTLTNTGTIGNLRVDGAATIFNKGFIGGDQISLSDSNDTYDGRGGSISGTVIAGGGSDTLMGGAQSDTFDGADRAWEYDGTLGTVRTGDGRTVVHWEPAVMHPGLTAGATLAVQAVAVPAGRLVDRNGAPLDDSSAVKTLLAGVKAPDGGAGTPGQAVVLLPGAGPHQFLEEILHAIVAGEITDGQRPVDGERPPVDVRAEQRQDARDVLAIERRIERLRCGLGIHSVTSTVVETRSLPRDRGTRRGDTTASP